MPTIDDVLYNEKMFTGHDLAQVHVNAHVASRGASAAPVTRHCQKVDLVGHVDVTHQIGQEHDPALQNTDQKQSLDARIIGGNFSTQCLHSRLQRLLVNENFLQILIVGMCHVCTCYRDN